jgi:hypothetical protein
MDEFKDIEIKIHIPAGIMTFEGAQKAIQYWMDAHRLTERDASCEVTEVNVEVPDEAA